MSAPSVDPQFESDMKAKMSALQVLADHKSKLDTQDYPSQVEAWNNYQDALMQVKATIKPLNGISLNRNIRSNMRWLSNTEAFPIHFSALMISILTFLVAAPAYGEFALPTLAITAAAAGATEGVYHLGLKKKYVGKQQMLRASCKPVLHINELEYAHVLIKGMPKVAKDPEINLPEMHLEVPRSWLANESLRSVVGQLEHIELVKPKP